MKRLALLLMSLCLALPAQAQLPAPERQAEAGVVDVATSKELAPLLERLGASFARQHPGIRIRIAARGSNVAMALLTTAQTDLAIIGREASEQEAKGFEWIYRHPPVVEPLFAGSFALPGHSPRLAVVVSKASPLRSITMAELAARFRPGGSGRIFMPDTESGTGRFFRHAVLADANQLDWDRIVEVQERDHARPQQVGESIAARVARDPDAIGIAEATPRHGVRAIPVTDCGDSLDRTVLAYLGHAVRPEASLFIQFVRSDAAHAIIAASPYRPLKNPAATAP